MYYSRDSRMFSGKKALGRIHHLEKGSNSLFQIRHNRSYGHPIQLNYHIFEASTACPINESWCQILSGCICLSFSLVCSITIKKISQDSIADMCKLSVWLDKCPFSYSNDNFHLIWNWFQMVLVQQAPCRMLIQSPLLQGKCKCIIMGISFPAAKMDFRLSSHF